MRQRNWVILAFIIIVILLITVVYLFFELRMHALQEKFNQQAPLSVSSQPSINQISKINYYEKEECN